MQMQNAIDLSYGVRYIIQLDSGVVCYDVTDVMESYFEELRTTSRQTTPLVHAIREMRRRFDITPQDAWDFIAHYTEIHRKG